MNSIFKCKLYEHDYIKIYSKQFYVHAPPEKKKKLVKLVNDIFLVIFRM